MISLVPDGKKGMLTAHQITKQYGINRVLNQVTFSINPADRIGLIGPNGSGKSTLIRILAGRERPDSGHVTYALNSLRIGYLSQGFEHPTDQTIAAYIGQISGDPDYLAIALRGYAEKLAREPDDIDLQEKYDAALDRINRFDSAKQFQILKALGLDAIDGEKRIEELSGDQKTRLSLAVLLLAEPQLLLLDEPTNHLDIQMLEWLESWLTAFSGAALVVSHDRTFLDHCVSQILDLNPETQTIRAYDGNYSSYIEQYVSEKEKETADYKDQEYEIRRMKTDISRLKRQAKWVETTTTPRTPGVRRIAKKVAAKAKAREKKLERYLSSEERLERPKAGWQLKLAFDDVKHLGRNVLSFEDLAVGYNAFEPLFTIRDLHVQAGQRIAITGANGSGKTTLLKTIMGRVKPLSGLINLGTSVRTGFMEQEQRLTGKKKSALEALREISSLNETEARSFLHFFLFTQDDPIRPLDTLSYGERARLQLALLVAAGANLLLLDEPINHLDIPSREMFEKTLAIFPGTVLAVVHDRYFINRFATDLWIVEGGTVESRIMIPRIQN